MSKFILVVMALVPFSALGLSKGLNRVYTAYTAQYYYDRNSIKYDGNLPEGHITAKNMVGHCWEMQYERVTRYGLILCGGVEYGRRRYDINIRQDFSGFDPDGTNSLKGFIFDDRTVVDLKYWGPKLMLGYRKRFSKDWVGCVKVGIADKIFIGGGGSRSGGYDVTFIDYKSDNGITHKSVGVLYKKMNFGYQLPVFDFYLGAERDMNMPWIKNISVGIECSRACVISGVVADMATRTSQSIDQLGDSFESFTDRNICIGIKVGVGFWK